MRRPILLAALLLVAVAAVAQDARHFIYSGSLDEAELKERGIRILKPLSNDRYLVSVTPSGERGASIATAAADSDLQPLTPEKKIHRSAIHMAGRGPATMKATVLFHTDVTMEQARDAIAEAGAALEDPLAFRFGPLRQLTVLIAPSSLERLAEDDRVVAIGGTGRFRIATENRTSAALHRVTELHQPPYGLTGEGVTLSLFEPASAQANHPEFGGRFTVGFSGGGSSDQSHATHVAGTIAASGIDERAKGMAPAARLHEFRAVNDEAVWLASKERDLPPLGVVADNNSWGYILGWHEEGGNTIWFDAEEYMGYYEAFTTAVIDQIAKDTNTLFVHSGGNDGDLPALGQWGQHKHVDNSGNTVTTRTWCFSQNGTGTDCPTGTCSSGTHNFGGGRTEPYCEKERHLTNAPYDTVGLTASGKNTIAVGAVDANGEIAGFSSRGPAKDGRVKPDVVARGVAQFSTNTSGGYTTKNGTSMAAPVVTGIAGILAEQWRRSFAGASPTGTELKAVIIAGARDLGNPGPDYTFGHGLVDAKASADLIIADAGTRTRIRNGAVAQGEEFEMPIGVRTPQNLRIVVSWPDPELTLLADDDIATPALVNDLDLVVIDPSGNEVKPYVLDAAARTNNATRGANKRDNTEVVEIANAATGVYRIRVRGTTIKDQSPQRFTVVSNVAALPACSDIQEQNDSAGAAFGNIPTGQRVGAAFCSQNDLDFFRFEATKTGAVTVTITTADQPLRATLSTGGAELAAIDVPANSTRTLTTNATSAPQQFVLQFTPTAGGSAVFDTSYSFTATYGQIVPPRRRTVRK